MSSTELVKPGHYERMSDVIAERMKGFNETEIARNLGMKRTEVLDHLDEYRQLIANDHTLVARARESVAVFDTHTDALIRKAYEVIDAADDEMQMNGVDSKLLGQKAAAVKLVSDLEAKRFAMLKEFGLLDDMEMGAKIAEAENRHNILIGILKDTVMKCDNCRPEVMQRLQRVTGEVEVIRVD